MQKALAMFKRRDEIEATFCKGFADMPQSDIENYYGEETLARVRRYFKAHPSARFLWIQNGCVGPEPKEWEK